MSQEVFTLRLSSERNCRKLVYFLIYLFIFGCIGSLLLHVGFLQLQQAGATPSCGAWASHCGGFSCYGARALGVWASVVVVCGLSSCGAWAQLLRSMWNLPGPGLKPLSPALAGRFLTTVPPGKPENWHIFFFKCLVEFTSEPIWAQCFIFGKLLIIDSISLINIGLFKLSVSSCVSFGRLYLLWKWSISSVYQICAYRVVHSISLLSF